MNSTNIIPPKPSRNNTNTFANLGQDRLININVKLPESLHYKLRILASIKKISLVACVQQAVEQVVQDQLIADAIKEVLPNQA